MGHQGGCEGSTKPWEQHAEAMRLTLARHDALLHAAIEAHQGHVFKTMGDAFCVAFASAHRKGRGLWTNKRYGGMC
jgi:class 3 adenylate cyclase